MISQIQSHKQQHKILPQQIQLLNLFHLNTIELEQRIQDEINENPLLEENGTGEDANIEKLSKDAIQDFQDWEEYRHDDIPDYKMEYENYLPADKIPSQPLADVIDFRDDLKRQCRFIKLPDDKYWFLDFLIDSLNEHGFLEQDLENIADEISFKKNKWIEKPELEQLLQHLQELDPVGVGSRNIRECLLIQLKKMNTKRPDVHMAIRLLDNYYHELRNGNTEKIKRDLGLEDDEVRIVLQLIATLKTKPVVSAATAVEVNQNILPDFVVAQEGDELDISLYRQRSASLHINQSWISMVNDAEKSQKTEKAVKHYLRSKLSAAQWFVSAIQQRETNMLNVMKAIVNFQYEYFRYGDIMMLKPMILKNIAEKVGVDISTVSRITCNKYVETPFGTLLLKNLFTEGLVNEDGVQISNRVIQTTIEEVIKAEDKKNPYTDQQLVQILLLKGYRIARRTIAKYREQLRIPVAQMRALWG